MAVYQLDDLRLISQTPGRLEFRGSGKTAGIILILFSLVWGGVPTVVLISSLCSGRVEPALFMLSIFSLIGLAMSAGGLALIFSWTGVTIDSTRQILTIIKKSISSKNKEEHHFKDIKEVVYSSEMRHRSKGGSYRVWLANLVSERGDNLCMGV
jgi:hypothetical protein